MLPQAGRGNNGGLRLSLSKLYMKKQRCKTVQNMYAVLSILIFILTIVIYGFCPAVMSDN